MSENRDAVNQSLSSLLDGEHDELDLKRVLKAAETDASVLETWSRYSRNQQLIKREATLFCDSDFLSSVQAAIEDEAQPERSEQKASRTSGPFDWAARVAVAACFTFAFLIGFNYLGSEQNADNAATASPQVAASVPEGFELPPLNARTVSSGAGSNFRDPLLYSKPVVVNNRAAQQAARLSPELQSYLNELMLRHAELSSASGSFGIMPLSRVNTLEEEPAP
jgi:sigma-E factor negative regulatory protein RseA